MTLLPCPNPKCGDNSNVFISHDESTDGDDTYCIECATCGTCGPVALAYRSGAARLWNALPREEPWIPVTKRLPESNEGFFDVATREGGLFVRLAWDTHYEFFHDGGPLSFVPQELTHWRPYREPRRPV